MADNIIKLKKNNTPGAVPTTSDLQYGELAINTADGILYVKRIGSGGDYIEKITPDSYSPYTWNDILSGITTAYGSNVISQPFATILGGYSNTNDGPGSTVVNGQNNSVVGSFSLVGGGTNNYIGINGDSSAIVGGDNNFVDHKNTFTLGSGLTSQSDNFTYTNNISSNGVIYDHKGNSNQWNDVFTSVGAASAFWTAAYNSLSNYLPLSGGTLTGKLTAGFTSTQAGLNIGNGTVPTSPIVGDIWMQQYTLNWRSPAGTHAAALTNGSNIFSRTQIIAVNDTGTTLRLTQSGTGNVLEVEDSANPDATPFVINNTGNVGIGVTPIPNPNIKLTVSGNISASGIISGSNLNTANWDSVYSNVQSNSGTYATVAFADNKFFPLTGGLITGNTRINGDVTIFGNLTSTGTQTFANTIFTTTSALSVVHFGSGPAMWVGNNGSGDIASFYDIDQNIEVLHVGGNNSIAPNVGVKTSTPNKDFTVNGEISASGIIWSTDGDSSQWSSSYSTVYSSSAYWSEPKSDVRLLSANWEDTYSVVLANSAYWNEPKSQVNSLTASWESTYSTVQANSASTWSYQGADLKALSATWSTYNYVNSTFLPLTGGIISGNLAVTGSISAIGSITTTKNLSANNIYGQSDLIIGTGAAVLYVNSANVGIKTETPNEALTVAGNISAGGTIFSLNSDSQKWDNTYSTVYANSGVWSAGGGSAGADIAVRALTGAWQNTYTTVNTNSATWATGSGTGADITVRALTGNWQGTYSTVASNSGNWQQAYTNQSNYLPLTGGTVSGSLSVTNTFTVTNTATVDAITLANANVMTFMTPVTASGDFLVLNINGIARAVRLWNF